MIEFCRKAPNSMALLDDLARLFSRCEWLHLSEFVSVIGISYYKVEGETAARIVVEGNAGVIASDLAQAEEKDG